MTTMQKDTIKCPRCLRYLLIQFLSESNSIKLFCLCSQFTTTILYLLFLNLFLSYRLKFHIKPVKKCNRIMRIKQLNIAFIVINGSARNALMFI